MRDNVLIYENLLRLTLAEESDDPAKRLPGVLVVENERVVRHVLGLALRRFGFSVRQAACGRQALRLYERYCDTIDVVLQEVQMPGMDGVQLLIALQRLNPAVRVVFMSSQRSKYSTDELFALGAARILVKPFNSLAEVAQVLGQVAQRSPPGPFLWQQPGVRVADTWHLG